MMKWILLFLLLSVSGISLGLWYLQDPGNVTIIWLGYEIQFSLITGFIFVVILFLLAGIIFRIFYGIQSVLRYFFSLFKRTPHEVKTEGLQSKEL